MQDSSLDDKQLFDSVMVRSLLPLPLSALYLQRAPFDPLYHIRRSVLQGNMSGGMTCCDVLPSEQHRVLNSLLPSAATEEGWGLGGSKNKRDLITVISGVRGCGGEGGVVRARVGTCRVTAPVLCWSVCAGGPESDGIQRGGDQRRVQVAVRRPPDGQHRVHDSRGSADHIQRRYGRKCVFGCRTKGDKMCPQTVETLQDAGI